MSFRNLATHFVFAVSTSFHTTLAAPSTTLFLHLYPCLVAGHFSSTCLANCSDIAIITECKLNCYFIHS